MSFDSPRSDLWLPDGAPHPGRLARARIRTAADIRTVESWTPDALLPAPTLYEAIRQSAEAEPQKPAILHMLAADTTTAPRTLSYAELLQTIHRSANFFRATAGDEAASVAIILPMLPEGLIAAWAGATAGTATPINPFLELRHTVALLNAVKANVLVTATRRYGPGAWDRLDEICAQVPTLRRVLVVAGDDPATDFHAAIASSHGGALDFEPACDPHGDAMYLPTGGTTAAPKLVRMSHRGQLLVAWTSGAMADASRDGIVAHAMPNFHVGGAVTLALRAVLFGQTLLTLTANGFRDPKIIANFWDIARRYRITSVTATPATAAAILGVAGTSADGHSINTFNCGGSTVPVDVARAFHDRFGIWLREVWGMSEFHGVISGHPGGVEPMIGSVGIPVPYQKVKAIEVDADNRFVRECAAGERGTLVIGGATTTPGYVDARLDAEFFVKDMPDGARWGNTGDLGIVDEHGYAWVFGRSKDMIIRGGHNIDPRMIEEVLVAHPAVQVAAAIGRPEAAKGELPIAYVQLKPGAEATPEALLEFCRERVQERAAAPAEVIIIAQMPMTAVGKIAKPALRNDAMGRVAHAVAQEILGGNDAVTVSIDESGLRPRVVLALTMVGDVMIKKQKLRDAFRNYEFAVDFVDGRRQDSLTAKH